MKTLIYHITYYDYDKSAYIHFASCNFRCLGCIRNRFTWDHHLYEEGVVKGVESLGLRMLSLEEFRKIIEGVEREMGLERAVLGGGEPTIDPAFCSIMEVLSGRGLEIALLTNGLLLGKVLNCIPKSCAIELSIKSIRPERFSMYTGRAEGDLSVVLENMSLAFQSGLELIVETILIPEFNEARDIELLAEYIAFNLSEDVPMIIDEYVPVPSAPWRRPTLEELTEARKRAEKHLRRVIVRSSYTMKRLGKIRLVHPEIGKTETL
jgi:pyruvate-formate lyase-activating enzyme